MTGRLFKDTSKIKIPNTYRFDIEIDTNNTQFIIPKSSILNFGEIEYLEYNKVDATAAGGGRAPGNRLKIVKKNKKKYSKKIRGRNQRKCSKKKFVKNKITKNRIKNKITKNRIKNKITKK